MAAEPTTELNLKPAITRALAGQDLWTALQLESWAKAMGLRQPAVLGTSEVFGDLRFAFPETISRIFEVNEQIIVCAGRRVYRLDNEGIPIGPSWVFPRAPHHWAITPAGDYIAGLWRTETYKSPLFFQVLSMTDGKTVMSGEFQTALDEGPSGTPVLSGDGRALAVTLTPSYIPPRYRVVVLLGGERGIVIPSAQQPQAVSGQGIWCVVNQNNRNVLWKSASEAIPVTAVATLNSGALVVGEDPHNRMYMLDHRGSAVSWTPPMPIGGNPHVWAGGSWVVLHSGNSPGPATLDALDRPIPGPKITPQLTAFTATGLAQATPQVSRLMDWNPSQLHQGNFFYSLGGQGMRLDLSSASQARELAIGATGAHITEFYSDGPTYIRQVRGQDMVFLDTLGREVWTGPRSDVRHLDRQHALVKGSAGKNHPWALHRLSLDPKARTIVPNVVDPTQWSDCRISSDGRWVVVSDSLNFRWAQFDALSGEKVAENAPLGPLGGAQPGPMRPVIVSQASDMPGHWRIVHSRMHPKYEPHFVMTPGERWFPNDMWRIDRGRPLLVTTLDKRLILSGRKPGEWLDMGTVPDNAGLWLRRQKNDVIIATSESSLLELVQGPRLVPLTGAAKEVRPETLPQGYWRVGANGNPAHMIDARGQTLQWDEQRTGFRIERLRGPASDRVFILCRSAMIALDPTLVRNVFCPAVVETGW